MSAITRASTIELRPTSTSAGPRQSAPSDNASSEQLSQTELAASAAGRLNSNPPFAKRLRSLKLSDDGHLSRFSAPETNLRSLRNGGFLAHRSPQGAKRRQKSDATPVAAETLVRDIRRATRKQYQLDQSANAALHVPYRSGDGFGNPGDVIEFT